MHHVLVKRQHPLAPTALSPTAGRTNESLRAAAMTIKTRRRDGGGDAASADAAKDASKDRSIKQEGREEGAKVDHHAAGDKGEGEGGTGSPGGGKDRKALVIAFTLRSSTYATMCIRELLKAHSEEAALGLRDV